MSSKRGTCPVCGEEQDVIQGPDGPWIGHHQIRWPKWCKGSTKPPGGGTMNEEPKRTAEQWAVILRATIDAARTDGHVVGFCTWAPGRTTIRFGGKRDG